MERWMRRRAAVGEGRWTMQKGDWKGLERGLLLLTVVRGRGNGGVGGVARGGVVGAYLEAV
jgi:hypothetical protein